MKDMKQPLLPHEELFILCQKGAGSNVWAISMSADEDGKHVWEVYCDDEKKIKKLPNTFKGQSVKAIFCKRPNVKK